MINFLGEKDYKGKLKIEGLVESLFIEGVLFYFYGKKMIVFFRKMGYVIIFDDNLEVVIEKVKRVKEVFKIKVEV